ncbi:MAG TPA: glycosyltransferase family 4 protein [Solirubrobacterales bacterium]|nr:glycosyltransferase family 4 protein [Solirubrobacterales bacterium]
MRTEAEGRSRRSPVVIRTLVLTPDYPPALGGIQRLVHRLLGSAPGLRAHVVAPDTPGAAAFDRGEGPAVRRVRVPPGPRALEVAALNLAALRQARPFAPQVVLSAHVVVAPAAVAVGRALGVPVVQYFHANEIGHRPRLAGFAARNADRGVAVSRYTRDLVLGVGGPAERIEIIHPGVDLPPLRGRTESPGRPTVLTISRIEQRYKGHDVMVRAMALVAERVTEVQWVVIGDGALRAEIADLARAAGLGDDTVRFLGAVGDRERDAWLARADVFAMPSRLPGGHLAGEGFGIVYLEAAAHGCPVVAGAVGGALDAVEDGVTGLLVDPTDHRAVAAALVALLEDRPRRERMAAAAAQRARRFAWPRVAAELEATIADLVHREPRGGRPNIRSAGQRTTAVGGRTNAEGQAAAEGWTAAEGWPD